ncbi:hypothetical protein P7K49_033804 [Saguinus oedipus]|uniref:Peptidase M12B propeptide domain-containing protein n=1 Tax=Saguinus oedipus TaxID=9490 RepID=A0ABQ9TSY9_SAGOE|nr:hypothetical protein P7K49_033804 [Saguinus oedipus]
MSAGRSGIHVSWRSLLWTARILEAGRAALDIVHPVRVDAGGSFLSYELWPRALRKRDLSGHRDAPAFYQLQYRGRELRFHLTANPHLLAPGFAHSPACHLLGEVQDPELEGGLAAISARYGLVSALGRGYSGRSRVVGYPFRLLFRKASPHPVAVLQGVGRSPFQLLCSDQSSGKSRPQFSGFLWLDGGAGYCLLPE